MVVEKGSSCNLDLRVVLYHMQTDIKTIYLVVDTVLMSMCFRQSWV